MPSEQLIRKIEAEVLDREHVNYPLLILPHEIAVQRLLKAYGDLTRDMNLMGYGPRAQRWWGTSLSHCLRWAYDRCPKESYVTDPPWEEQDQHAVDLLRWGREYALLFNDHVAWSRSLIQADADASTRTITFQHRDDVALVVGAQDKDEAIVLEEMSSIEPCIDSIYRRWVCRIKWDTKNGLSHPPGLVASMSEIEQVKRWSSSLILPELPDSERVGGYSLGQLRQFHACVYALCSCVAMLEDNEDSDRGSINQMGSWVQLLPLDEMVKWLTPVSALPSGAVEAIVQDWTFDASRTHSSLLASPLIPTRRGFMAFSPRLVSGVHPQRMILSALTTGSGHGFYDRVSERVQDVWLARIANILEGRGKLAQEPKLNFRDGMRTPDFLFLDEFRKILYIIDFKNHVVPTDVRGVCSQVVRFEGDMAQVRDYIDKIRSERVVVERKTGFLLDECSFQGVLLFRQPMPLPVSTSDDVIVVDWQTVGGILLTDKDIRFSDVIERLRPHPSSGAEFGMQRIRVRGWTYRRMLPLRPAE